MGAPRPDVKSMEMQLPPMSNAFHCSAYKMAMSHRREKNSLYQRSLIGMDGLYEVVFHDRDLGLRLDINGAGDVVVHSVRKPPALPPKSGRAVVSAKPAPPSNLELIVPGDILVSIGCIGVRAGDVSLKEVAELIQLQARPIRLVFESQVARNLKCQLQETLGRLVFEPKMQPRFDVGLSTRDLVFQTSLEMVIDFSFNLYAWFDPLRVMHLVLFDDVLLITEAKDKGQRKSRLLVKYLFPLQLLHARDLIAQADYIPSSFELLHPSRTFTFVARDEAAKKEMLDALTMAIALAANASAVQRGWQYQFVSGTLHQCALQGNARGIEHTMRRSPPSAVNEPDVNGWTPLFYAAIRSHSKVIRQLATLGIDLNAADDFGLTALHYACLYQCPSSVDALVECGADVHCKDVYGRSPLFLCAINEDPLLPEPLPVDLRAVKLCMQLLVAAGADLNTTDGEGLSALEHNLCVDVPKVRALLEAGVVLDTVYEGENTILHLACDHANMSVHPDLIQVLLEFGAQPNAVNADGNTALHLLCYQYHARLESLALWENTVVRAMELLIAHGARFNLANVAGATVEQLLESHHVPCAVGKALVLWQSKRRILASPRVLDRADGPKQRQIVQLQVQPAEPPPSACSICRWECEWQPATSFFDVSAWTKATSRVGLYSCSVCLVAVCGLCSLKHLGVYLVHSTTQAHYDLPPSLQSKTVCDGCYNFAFYDLAREMQSEPPPPSSRPRPRTRSLQGLRLY
ncbi:ankyrin repeat domain-containing protein 50-like [Achlya hypogyna]|uniref:Ankyrin repeat domain-containing protein 50-like n=1 Tax=Achlya hypogyna TaxID=1202772 RepID=A0A1V9Z3F9_ACHHY|nr:ankyrin repeat domain-containing protein 50-like [Achlya hypogyna]